MTPIERPSEPDPLSVKNTRQNKARQGQNQAKNWPRTGQDLAKTWPRPWPGQDLAKTMTRPLPRPWPGHCPDQDKASPSTRTSTRPAPVQGPVQGQDQYKARTRTSTRPGPGQGQYQDQYQYMPGYHTPGTSTLHHPPPGTHYPVPTTQYPVPHPPPRTMLSVKQSVWAFFQDTVLNRAGLKTGLVHFRALQTCLPWWDRPGGARPTALRGLSHWLTGEVSCLQCWVPGPSGEDMWGLQAFRPTSSPVARSGQRLQARQDHCIRGKRC